MNKENISTHRSEEVDAYIQGFPEQTRAKLEEMRGIIEAAAPGAREVISYRMPAFKLHGILVYFAAWKNHIGLYPASSGMAFFHDRLKDYKTSKGAIQFPLNQPLPAGIIAEIVQYRVQENQVKRSCLP